MTDTEALPALVKPPRLSLVTRVAERFGVEPGRMMDTLKATAFKSDKPVSNEQMMALLIVADQYRLNPFTKEIFAFPDKGGIVPVVGVDGWARIINEHPMMDGVEFAMQPDGSACTTAIFRKDRAHAIRVTEYLSECKRETAPWRSHPKRMLRHKSLIQCARLAFGFAGIYDEDEGERIVHAGEVERVEAPSQGAARVRAALAGEVVDVSSAPVVEVAPEPPDDELFAKCMQSVLVDDRELAALSLAEAKDVLTDEQHAELTVAFNNRSNPRGD